MAAGGGTGDAGGPDRWADDRGADRRRAAEERRADDRLAADEDRRALQEELDAWAAELVDNGVGLARLAVGGAFRTARWGVGRSLGIAERVVGAIARGESVSATTGRAANDARHALLELTGLEDPVEDDPRRPTRATGTSAGRRATDRASVPELRRRGAELLRRSADVEEEVETHPSYARILDNLAPDEARVLRLLAEAGPQPQVDVRTASPIPGNSELVASGLSMIGSLAGCRYVERVPAYLNNLFRLGLVWFSEEELDDRSAYQVLEAQPEVIAAVESVRRARTVRRSVELTPFGRDFVATCLLVPPPA